MKKNNKKAFTLIELLIVMTIMAIISMAMYTPYQHYQTKQKVRNSANIITQALYDARSNAIYGISNSTGNLDVGVLFEKNSEELKVLKFPFNNFPIDYKTNSDYILEKIPLESGVEITSSGGLYLYKAITGSGIYKNVDVIDNKSNISVGFRQATTGLMIKNIEYYTKTYISDVK